MKDWKARRLGLSLMIGLLFLGLLCADAAAQTINGSIHGTVTDSSGGVIPGAQVVVKNLTNGQVRQATTTAVGFYTITQLPPARYSVTVSKPGFQQAHQVNIQLLVNEDLEANYTLQVGKITQRVVVSAAPPMLKTANASLGQVIGSRQIVNLPLNGRQFTQLILLTPGAAPKESGQQSAFTIPIGGGGISPISAKVTRSG